MAVISKQVNMELAKIKQKCPLFQFHFLSGHRVAEAGERYMRMETVNLTFPLYSLVDLGPNWNDSRTGFGLQDAY